MKVLSNLGFAWKLVLLIAPGMVALLLMVGWNAYTNNLSNEYDAQLDELTALRGEGFAAALAAAQYGAAIENEITDTAAQARNRFEGLVTSMGARVVAPDNPALREKITELSVQMASILKLPARPEEGLPDEADLLADLVTDLDPLLVAGMELLQAAKLEIRSESHLFIGLGVVMFLFAGIIVMMRRIVLKPILQSLSVIESMREGDLTRRLHIDSKDEFGALAHALNHSLEGFQEIVTEIKNVSQRMSTASDNFDAVTHETTAGTKKQQSELAQLATAINEMVSTVQATTVNTSRAAEFAIEAASESTSGMAMVQEVIDAIDQLVEEVALSTTTIQALNDNSVHINMVVEVINGIAEQTNLLALNAAIEAARAGDQGRGFSVVADEVRTLASKTHGSTKEIHDIVAQILSGTDNAVKSMDKSQQRAITTVEIASKAGDGLIAIKKAVDEIDGMNHQVAASSEEHLVMTEELNRNVHEISMVADENARMTSRMEKDSAHLTGLSHDLLKLTSKFNVG